MLLQQGIRQLQSFLSIADVALEQVVCHHVKLPAGEEGRVTGARGGESLALSLILAAPVHGGIALIINGSRLTALFMEVDVEAFSALADHQSTPDGRVRLMSDLARLLPLTGFHGTLRQNFLNPLKFLLRDNRRMRSPDLCIFQCAVVFDLLLLQIVRGVFLVVGNDSTIE